MAYASVNDVSVRLGRSLSAAETAQAQAWLDDVEEIIKARFVSAALTLPAQIALGAPTLGTVRRVEANAVVRRMQNPGGLTSITRTVDDASITERRETGSSSGWLGDDDWLDLLDSYSDTGAFSTSPGFEPDYNFDGDPWYIDTTL